MSWWWIPIAFFAGQVVILFLIGILSGGSIETHCSHCGECLIGEKQKANDKQIK